MGIVNVTDDSFYAGSRTDVAGAVERARKLVADGADWLDIGACSTRPGAPSVAPETELERIRAVVPAIRAVLPDVPLSVDTFRAAVAAEAVTGGADIINDISGGDLDSDMLPEVARMGVPYIMMHMRGNPQNMQTLTDYTASGGDVTAGVIAELSEKIARFEKAGVRDIIIDPGFGFSKTLQQNYELLRNLERLQLLGKPVLVGISRKSMITKLLGITPDEALNGTTVLNTVALQKGAAILRVHDAREASQAVRIAGALVSPE